GIVEDVRKNGDKALRRYAKKWDGVGPKDPLRVPTTELEQAWRAVSPEFRNALQIAAANIRSYCERHSPHEWRAPLHPLLDVGQLVGPLQSAVCYVPGGRYPLPSTLLMTVIPAQFASVGVIRVASRRPAPETLAAAFFLGVHEFYR